MSALTLEGKDADWPFWIKTPDTYTDKKKTTVLVPGEERHLHSNLVMVCL